MSLVLCGLLLLPSAFSAYSSHDFTSLSNGSAVALSPGSYSTVGVYSVVDCAFRAVQQNARGYAVDSGAQEDVGLTDQHQMRTLDCYIVEGSVSVVAVSDGSLGMDVYESACMREPGDVYM